MTDDRVVVAVVATDDGDAELLADLLFRLGASAVSERGDRAARELVADLPAAAPALLDRPHRVLERDPTWTGGWRAHASAVPVGERLRVRPEWVAPAPPGDDGVVEVVVAAADAFGSGAHPTTALCLAAVERLVRPGDRVLDVGSGSGVLGVAALLLGAGSLVAIDVDPLAVDATRRTAELNGMAVRADVSDRPLAAVPGRHDLVLANLLVPIVEELGADLAARTAAGGHLVVSGLLHDHEDRAAAAIGLPVVAVERSGPWSAIVLAPRDDPTVRRDRASRRGQLRTRW